MHPSCHHDQSLTIVALVDRVRHRGAAGERGREAGVLDVTAVLGYRASRGREGEEATHAESKMTNK